MYCTVHHFIATTTISKCFFDVQKYRNFSFLPACTRHRKVKKIDREALCHYKYNYYEKSTDMWLTVIFFFSFKHLRKYLLVYLRSACCKRSCDVDSNSVTEWSARTIQVRSVAVCDIANRLQRSNHLCYMEALLGRTIFIVKMTTLTFESYLSKIASTAKENQTADSTH